MVSRTLIAKLNVVLVALFGVISLGERLPAFTWTGVALIAADTYHIQCS